MKFANNYLNMLETTEQRFMKKVSAIRPMSCYILGIHYYITPIKVCFELTDVLKLII